MEKNKENGDIFQDDLARMVHDLKKNIPNIGIYIWNYAEDKETHNTQHTIISANAFEILNGEKALPTGYMTLLTVKSTPMGLNCLNDNYGDLDGNCG